MPPPIHPQLIQRREPNCFSLLFLISPSFPYRERATSFCAERRRPKAWNEKIQSPHRFPSHHLYHAAAVKHIFSQTIKRKMLCKTCTVSCIIAIPIENAKCIAQGRKRRKRQNQSLKRYSKWGIKSSWFSSIRKEKGFGTSCHKGDDSNRCGRNTATAFLVLRMRPGEDVKLVLLGCIPAILGIDWTRLRVVNFSWFEE
jgi:hypothetical protein